MRKILKVTSMLGVVTVMKIAAGIIRAKFLAWQIGPAGIGLVSQATTYSAFAIQLCSLSVVMGITKNISESAAQADAKKASMTVNMSVTMQFIASVLFMALVLPLSPFLARFVFSDPGYLWYFVGITITTPFALFLVGIADPVFYGFRKIPEYTKMMSSYIAIGLILVFPAVFLFKTNGMLMQIMAVSVIGFAIAYYFIVKETSIRPKVDLGIFRDKESKEMIGQLLKYGLTSFLMGSATILTTLYLRSLLIRGFGVAANGYYQVAYAISASYLPFITNAVWGYFYPAMCALQDKDSINRELNQFVRFALFASTAIAALCIIFRYYIIIVLYSKEFMPSYGLLAIQAVGDVFFILFYILNTSLLARKRFRSTLLISTLGYNAALVALYMGLASFSRCGIASLNIAVAVTNLFFAAGLMLYHYLDTRFLMDSKNKRLLIKSAALIILICIMPGREIWAVFVKILLAGIWLVWAFTKEETGKFLELLNLYFKRRSFSV